METWALGPNLMALALWGFFFGILFPTNEKSEVTALGNLSATLMVRILMVTAVKRVPYGVSKKSETVGMKSSVMSNPVGKLVNSSGE